MMKPYVWKDPGEEFNKNLEQATVFFNNVDKNNPELADIGRLGRTLIDALDLKEDEKNGAYWERNLLALYFATYANNAYREYLDLIKLTNNKTYETARKTPPCGWYRHPSDNEACLDAFGFSGGTDDKYWESPSFSFYGWSRVVSLFEGRLTFHVPDDFDLGDLPEVKPNWDGHSTEEKWWRVMSASGCDVAPLDINGWSVRRLKKNAGFIAFHPIHDGHYWEQFENFGEVKAFCTKERFDDWAENLK